MNGMFIKQQGGICVRGDYSAEGDSVPDAPADTPTPVGLINFCHVVHWI